MIKTIKTKSIKRLYENDDRSKLPADMVDRIRNIVSSLDSANSLDDLNIPSYKLHPLTGNRNGQWSITVRSNWRIVFKFENGNAYDVEFVDYH